MLHSFLEALGEIVFPCLFQIRGCPCFLAPSSKPAMSHFSVPSSAVILLFDYSWENLVVFN